MGAFWILVTGGIYFFWALIIGIYSLFTFSPVNVISVIICLLAGLLVLGVTILGLFIKLRFIKLVGFGLSIIGILFLIAVVSITCLTVYDASRAFAEMITGTLDSTKGFIDDLESITTTGQNTAVFDFSQLNYNTYNARIESANKFVLAAGSTEDQVAAEVERIMQDQKSPEPNYAEKLNQCAVKGLSPKAPTPVFSEYSNFFAYRIYESFSSYGILCSFTKLDILNFKKWPIGCYESCGYKALDTKEKLLGEVGSEALTKYIKGLLEKPMETRESCICHTYHTIVVLGTDITYLLYFVLLCLFPLFGIFGCCCMISYPTAAYKMWKKIGKREDKEGETA